MGDSLLIPQTIVKPRTFVGLMTLYESNYIRLLRIIPGIHSMDGCFKSRSADNSELSVEILETSKHTITLSITYLLNTSEGLLSDPDMIVRVYLDGKQAEVLNIGKGRRVGALRRFASEHRKEIDRRWRLNIILNKWLEYLSDQGHLIIDY
ncbi:MAG: hypothetical protein CMO97_03625 [Woeseia sp.]|nr:hypothetical protein [Woeseia sp.]|tara:strand:- start:444 stop:896 length:453 start_codon:yes stop_codon:yes gene_type:complete